MSVAKKQKKIGQYEILAEIGRGAFGKVFKGRDVHLEKVVAIKELQLDDPSALRDEARVLSELRHENIVGFRQFFPDGNRWYLVMDFIEGGSLSEWIRGRKLYAGRNKSPVGRICSIGAQSAEGLAYAHKHGIIHQDVKPTNIMVTVSGIAKVADFGLANAKAVSQSTNPHEQDITVTVGGLTPAYCSPEQAGKQRLNTKTDVWSWGLSVLEMFAGGLFWRVGPHAQAALDHFAEGPPDRYAVGEMPGPVFNLLQKCFDPNPEARPSLVDSASVLKSHSIPSEDSGRCETPESSSVFSGDELQEQREHFKSVLIDLRDDLLNEDGTKSFAGSLLISSALSKPGNVAYRQDALHEVEEALNRISNGNYGKCESCGTRIKLERLATFPCARYCVGCQRQSERGSAV